MNYKGNVIEVKPISRYVLYINGKKAQRGSNLIMGRTINELEVTAKELLDSGMQTKENGQYISFLKRS